MGLTNKKIEVSCKTCNNTWLKRQDSLKSWLGNCRSCASIELAKEPYIKEIQRQNGIMITKRFGGVLNAIKFTSEMVSGEKNSRWKGGITSEVMKIRNSTEYKLWRKAIFERDNYTCQICNQIGGTLNADHIKPFSLYPDLRLDLNNGRTLCISCHKLTDTYGFKLIYTKQYAQ